MGMVWTARLATDDQVRTLRSDPGKIYDFVTSEAGYRDGTAIGLDKQWHADHFLLVGSADAVNSPLSLIIGQFENLGPDNGYGPAWFVPKPYLTSFDHALSALTRADLSVRYDAQAMVKAEVYIADTLLEEGAEAKEYILDDIDILRKFAARAAKESLSAFALIT